MANYDSVCQLNSRKNTWRVCVRICRKWTRKGYAKFPLSLELFMVDHQGAFIHGTVNSPLIRQFDNLIIENEIYDLYNFKVEYVDYKNAICENPFKIKFIDETSIVLSTFDGFSSCIYNFKSFFHVLTDGENEESCPLFDVIGHVVCVSRDAGSGDVLFFLQDLCYISVCFLIKPPFSKKESNFIEEGLYGKLNQRVVILQLCQAKYYKGRIVLYSFPKATKIIFGSDSEHAKNYIMRLNYRYYHPLSSLSPAGVLSIPETVLSLSKLVRAREPMTVWSIGWICDIVNIHDWFITVCEFCKFKRDDDHGNVICPWCNGCSTANFKYRVIVSVSNGVSNVKLCLLDNVVAEMVGLTATEAMKSRPQVPSPFVQGFAPSSLVQPSIPFEVHSIIGKEFLFKVRIASCHVDGRENIYDVEDFSDDGQMLKLHRSLLHKNPLLLSDASTSSPVAFQQ